MNELKQGLYILYILYILIFSLFKRELLYLLSIYIYYNIINNIIQADLSICCWQYLDS